MDNKIEENIAQATHTLLEPTGLNLTACEKALSVMLGHQLDYADLYFQDYCSEHYSLEDGIIKEGGTDIQRGVGVRALSAEKTGFAYSNDLALPCLLEAAHCAKNIAQSGKNLQHGLQTKHSKVPQLLYPALNPLTSILPMEKIQLLKKLDAYARAKDPRITQVMLGLHAAYETVLVFATDGTLAADVRPLVRLDVTIVVEQNGRKETGWCGGGGRTDYLYFLEGDKAYTYVDEAVRQALVNLESVAAPAGNMTVVLGPGWPGVLLHEAVGHGLEGDFNRKKTSVYSGKIGQQVASPLCTVVDDGTIAGRRGSLTVDDEGTPSQRNVLIENGILKGYLQDKHNARLMGTQSTGSGRRESYSSMVLPRMTNTFLMPGQHTPEEIIGSVENGLYAANFGGGSVDITSGKFVFSATEAYLIEKGKITKPVKGATLVGQGSVVMNNITMVGNDFALDTGIGICGKDGQSVPVGVGQPTLKIENMTVGGTK